jgi:alcohol dehydrogenase
MYQMYIPTRTLFGAGQLNNLHNQALPGNKAVVVISNGKSARENGYLDKTLAQLKLAKVDYTIFDKVQANPLKSTVMDGAAFARENGCDFVVALGGGSVMDASKLIAMMAMNEGDLWDYVSYGTGKGKTPSNRALPVVAITTTAGTGSEVDPWGVISNSDTNEKIGIGGADDLFPVLAIVDPELMLSVSPKSTAYQGFDALFHSTEGYISLFANELSDMYALTAIENVAKNLPTAVKDGNDLEARTKVAFGNTLSGYMMVVGTCTSEHALEHAMSAYHQDLPHGAGLIMISKAYYAHFINKHVCDDRFVKMAQVMGYPNAKAPMDFLDALIRLQEACGVADLKMSDYGLDIREFGTLSRNARATMGDSFACDRAPLTDDDCIEIFKASYK